MAREVVNPSIATSEIVKQGLLNFNNDQGRSWLREASIFEINERVEAITLDVFEENPQVRPCSLYKKIADRFPMHISEELDNTIVSALESSNENIRTMGKKALTFFHLRSVIKPVEKYFVEGVDDVEELDEMVQIGLTGLQEKVEKAIAQLDGLRADSLQTARMGKNIQELSDESLEEAVVFSDPKLSISSLAGFVYFASEDAIARYISKRDSLPYTFVVAQDYKELIAIIKGAIGDGSKRLSKAEIAELAAGELSNQVRISIETLKGIIASFPMNIDKIDEKELLEDDQKSPFNQAANRVLFKLLDETLGRIKPRQALVLEALFFEGKTEVEVAATLLKTNGEPVTPSRVSQIKNAGIGRIKYKDIVGGDLRSCYSEEDSDGYIRIPGSSKPHISRNPRVKVVAGAFPDTSKLFEFLGLQKIHPSLIASICENPGEVNYFFDPELLKEISDKLIQREIRVVGILPTTERIALEKKLGVFDENNYSEEELEDYNRAKSAYVYLDRLARQRIIAYAIYHPTRFLKK